MLRWRIQLSAYSFNISYIPGKENIFADYLSRLQDIQTIATIDSETMTEKIWKTHKKLGHASADTIISELEKHQPVNKETKKLAKELIQSCTQCQKVAPFRGTKTTGHLIASSTFDCISVDTIGEMDEDKLGNRYIIVAVDDFSRFVFIRPYQDCTASSAISFFKDLFALFGTPNKVRTDNAKQFIAKPTEDLLKEREIEHILTIPYDHSGNGKLNASIGKSDD
ncbi:unnamed protein product [Aduncisulcus paluster]|uniref:Unnamed protein product n=1 Tax=Aduncisulcus paluster TaxID=2918883 RepID=A0ABQ5KFL4_9EUKA|nr:unnamed protein product [Aduncisulcus paluster]